MSLSYSYMDLVTVFINYLHLTASNLYQFTLLWCFQSYLISAPLGHTNTPMLSIPTLVQSFWFLFPFSLLTVQPFCLLWLCPLPWNCGCPRRLPSSRCRGAGNFFITELNVLSCFTGYYGFIKTSLPSSLPHEEMDFSARDFSRQLHDKGPKPNL